MYVSFAPLCTHHYGIYLIWYRLECARIACVTGTYVIATCNPSARFCGPASPVAGPPLCRRRLRKVSSRVVHAVVARGPVARTKWASRTRRTLYRKFEAKRGVPRKTSRLPVGFRYGRLVQIRTFALDLTPARSSLDQPRTRRGF